MFNGAPCLTCLGRRHMGKGRIKYSLIPQDDVRWLFVRFSVSRSSWSWHQSVGAA